MEEIEQTVFVNESDLDWFNKFKIKNGVTKN